MPVILKESIESVLRNGETVIIAAETDLSKDLKFEKRWLIVTSQRLIEFDPGKKNISEVIELVNVRKIFIEDLFGI